MHRLSGIDGESFTATCAVCGPNTRIYRSGDKRYWRCGTSNRRDIKTPPQPKLKGLEPNKKATKAEWAWAAGVIEGEAYFDPRQHVIINMVDRDVLARIQEICGGVLNGPYAYPSRKPTNQPYYVWTLGNKEHARYVVEKIRPWMGERRSKKIAEIYD